mmetsp:Transcript_11575/g.23323  ORF Transcript_11575/g.23323 Transcript_11575/m.23323 type:complete len:217 (-) Transcript_11575:1334-1984(-)
MEGGQRLLRRASGVPVGADLCAPHHRQPRRARGAHRFVRKVRPLRGGDRRNGGRPGPRARAHGNLHGAGRALLQVQREQGDGAHQALLVAPQHPQDAQGLRGIGPVGGAYLPLPSLRRVRQRRPLHDRSPHGGIRARQIQGHDRQGDQYRNLLQGHHVLSRAATHDAQRPLVHHVAAHRSRAGGATDAQGEPRTSHQALLARHANVEHQGGQRRLV